MPTQKAAWPKALPERIPAVRDLLHRDGASWTAKAVAGTFTRAKVEDAEIPLQSLAALGLVVRYRVAETEACALAARRAA